MQINPQRRSIQRDESFSQSVDLGLRSYMTRVYGHVSFGLFIVALVSYVASTNLEVMAFLHGGFQWVIFLAMIGMAVYLPMRIQHMQSSTAQLLFLIFAFVEGLALSSIFLLYTGASIARVFFISATMFGATSLYGYVTKNDLTKMGSFLFMALIGMVIASVVNIFLHSTGLQLVLSFVGVILFTGLTAYDTQRIKNIYLEQDSLDVTEKKAVLGAFALFLDFINLFVSLLQLLGERK